VVRSGFLRIHLALSPRLEAFSSQFLAAAAARNRDALPPLACTPQCTPPSELNRLGRQCVGTLNSTTVIVATPETQTSKVAMFSARHAFEASRHRRLKRLRVQRLLALVFVSCSGAFSPLGSSIGTPPVTGSGGTNPGGGPTDTPPNGASGPAFPATIRRLSQPEIQSVLASALDFKGTAPVSFPGERFDHGFESQYDRLTLSLGFGDALQSVAEAASEHVSKNLSTLAPCPGGQPAELQCLSTFLSTKGAALYRRPLSSEEAGELTALYTQARAEVDYAGALGAVVEAMVQSPRFLFRTELGASDAPQAVVQLTPTETASALSFWLTAAAPDEALQAAAADGTLATASGRRAQAERLLQSEAGRTGLRNLLVQWLGLSRFRQLVKDDAAFTDSLKQSMLEETTRALDSALAKADGSFADMFLAGETFVNPELAKHYGLSVDAGWQRVAVDSAVRRGLLTQASLLTRYSQGKTTRSPIPFGLFLQERILCGELGVPPPGVGNLVPPANLTTMRQISTTFRQNNKDCQACHKQIDGAALPVEEQFDLLGRLSPIDTGDPDFGTGFLIETDQDGPFVGAPALAAALAKSEQVKSCFAAHLLSASTGVGLTAPSRRTAEATRVVTAANRSFATGSIRALLLAWVESDDFVNRNGTQLPVRQP
jgi:Protein of unknown function (DUF1592)/Protein of unknown function (DUF1588)/Protein of unknown function (DUF1595)